MLIKLTFLKGLVLIRRLHPKSFFICLYWYFLDKRFKLQLDVCNGCRDVLMMSMYFNHIALSNILLSIDYHSIFSRISKSEAVNLLQDAKLSKKKWIIIKYDFLLCIKNG